ncbi:hypothetical protein BKA65DRAFT_512296 [Rhexocercosporidium sp. MPI-PUGE-AT-0058]|nr:hypothetical protein BKA65DRAFT_512296 [Rhexocercosporidium sp. MPI-PUGE-AT-0058]
MKISSTYLVLAGIYGVAAREALHTAIVSYSGEGHALTPQNNRNGWVNPEDLAPMPQCIAQQDQSTWLSAMTKCTSKRCTRHFGVICTHHQWLTQLSCLSNGFSPDVIEGYFPYCGRSVLAKAQLYLWIRTITGRTWLVDVGDANGLQNLSPASLAKGYTAVDVTYKAPTCLTGSVSALSIEPFQHVMASCSFTSISQHTGNAVRPWEYSESLRSMIALDFETVGYDLTGSLIRYGDYFDKECFCSAFTIDLEKEPCSGPGPGQMDLMKERLWVNATCGSTSLPDNWTDILKTTEFAYIPIEDWHWPMCVADMPKQVMELPDQCVTDACEINSSGYCKVKRAIDRACFCRDISYESCGGSCQIFKTRIDYIKWLHDLCGNLQDWHGLPDNWRQLAAPTPLDMIPWRWTLKPSNDSNIAYVTRLGSIRGTETCASNEWKLGSFALVNIATVLAVILSQRKGIRRVARGFLWHPHPWCWFFKGTLIAALQLLANWINAFLVQNTAGYKDIPVIQLMLLWCSIPRLAWLPILLIVQPFEEMSISAAASSLYAEMFLQFLSSYYMVMTVNYGWKHDFYFGGMEGAERGGLAKIMYAGAFMWFITIGLALGQLTRATRRMGKSRGSEEKPLMSSEGGDYAVYGTFSIKVQNNLVSQKASVELYAATVISMLVLWIGQWVFWGGFIGLSSEEFCPPKLGVLTVVWIAFSLAGATVAAT